MSPENASFMEEEADNLPSCQRRTGWRTQRKGHSRSLRKTHHQADTASLRVTEKTGLLGGEAGEAVGGREKATIWEGDSHGRPPGLLLIGSRVSAPNSQPWTLRMLALGDDELFFFTHTLGLM